MESRVSGKSIYRADRSIVKIGKKRNIKKNSRGGSYMRPVGLFFFFLVDFIIITFDFPFLALHPRVRLNFGISADEHNNFGSSTDGTFSSKSGSPQKGFL